MPVHITYKTIQVCPQCNVQLVNPVAGICLDSRNIGTPLMKCPQCQKDFLDRPPRNDEWEMLPIDALHTTRDDVIRKVTDYRPELDYGSVVIVSGALGALVGGGTLVGALVYDVPRAYAVWGYIVAPIAVGLAAAGLLAWWLASRQSVSNLRQRIDEVEKLLGAIEQSRQRMADTNYRARLQRMGLAVRGPHEATEPTDVASSFGRLQQLAADLRADLATASKTNPAEVPA